MNLPSEATAAWEVFAKAPIVEAVLDLRASLPPDASHEALATYRQRVGERYPYQEQQVHASAQIALSATGITTGGERRPYGFRFASSDHKWIVQVRLDGFTVNHLAPYTQWSELRARAVELWKHYVDVARPLSVERIGLRYINRIFVPLGAQLSEYFDLEPRIGPNLPQQFVGFNLQVAFEDPSTPAMILIQQRRGDDDPTRPGHAAVILDVDVFKEEKFEPQSLQLWHTLDNLRDLKNRIFFNAVTDKAKESFR